MLATGGSASFAADLLKRSGCRDVRLLCLVVAPEGVRRMESDHRDVPIYAAALDRTLDARGFILPGLGDAGDRIFGTA
jgi:uracil phosphoribosyltransferase